MFRYLLLIAIFVSCSSIASPPSSPISSYLSEWEEFSKSLAYCTQVHGMLFTIGLSLSSEAKEMGNREMQGFASGLIDSVNPAILQSAFNSLVPLQSGRSKFYQLATGVGNYDIPKLIEKGKECAVLVLILEGDEGLGKMLFE